MSPPTRKIGISDLLRGLGGERGDSMLLLVLAGFGTLMFILAGSLYDPDLNPGTFDPFIHDPWSLYLFFSVMMIVLELAVLRGTPKGWSVSRARQQAVLGLTTGVLLVVGIGAVFHRQIEVWLTQLPLNIGHLFAVLGAHKWIVFVTLNIALVVIFWVGIRYSASDPAPHDDQDQKAPFFGERMAANFIAGIIFSWLLAWVFFTPLLNFVATLGNLPAAHAAGAGTSPAVPHAVSPPLTVCDVSVALLKYCPTGVAEIETLFTINLLILPAVYLLGALSLIMYAALLRANQSGRIEEYPQVFRETVSDLIHRRLNLNLVLSLRIFWPLLIVFATVCAVIASAGTAATLLYASRHGVSHDNVTHVEWWGIWFTRYGRDLLTNLIARFGAVAAVIGILVFTVAAITLAITPYRRGHNYRSTLRSQIAFSWRHLRFFGLLLTFTYWGFSAIFSLVNGLILGAVRIGEDNSQKVYPSFHWAPFVQPDPVALLSLAIFILFMFAGGRPQRSRSTASTSK